MMIKKKKVLLAAASLSVRSVLATLWAQAMSRPQYYGWAQKFDRWVHIQLLILRFKC